MARDAPPAPSTSATFERSQPGACWSSSPDDRHGDDRRDQRQDGVDVADHLRGVPRHRIESKPVGDILPGSGDELGNKSDRRHDNDAANHSADQARDPETEPDRDDRHAGDDWY